MALPLKIDFKDINLVAIKNGFKNIFIYKDKDFLIIFELLKRDLSYFIKDNVKFIEDEKIFNNFGNQINLEKYKVDPKLIKDRLLNNFDKIVPNSNKNEDQEEFKIIKIISNIYQFSLKLNINFLDKPIQVKFKNKIKLYPDSTLNFNLVLPFQISLYNKDDDTVYFNLLEIKMKNSYIGEINLDNGYFCYSIDGIIINLNLFEENLQEISFSNIDNLLINSNFSLKNNMFLYSVLPLKLVNKSFNIIELQYIILEQNELNVYNFDNKLLLCDILEYTFLSGDKIVKEYKVYSTNTKFEYNLVSVINKREIVENSIIKRTMNILFQ
ncbi:MAG: hypothetical protein N3A58_06615 [Spirochaetes bacterium]|nr:hypothetical protein [Spirochaetota bacterium]